MRFLMKKIYWYLFILIVTVSCNSTDRVIVKLSPQTPQEGKGPNWSPYGQKMKLTENKDGMETTMKIGDNPSNQWSVLLSKTDSGTYFNTLFIDQNQNGQFEDSERIDTDPSELRGKIWSSFNAAVFISVTNPWTKKEEKNIYPISLWYVLDPSEEADEEVLRFSRRGWLEGNTMIHGVEATVIFAEAVMDAKIDTADQWSIAPTSLPKELYDYRNSRSVKDHAWLNDDAYRLVEVDPSGMKAVLEPYDPGISRVEEAEKLDIYSSDKKAAHSGMSVQFNHDFQAALDQARKENKKIFLDFETTWCGPCKIMDKLVYTADDVVKAAEEIIAVKIDGDDHPELTKRFKVSAYPTLILLSSEEKVIERKVGYQSVRSTVQFLNTTIPSGTLGGK